MAEASNDEKLGQKGTLRTERKLLHQPSKIMLQEAESPSSLSGSSGSIPEFSKEVCYCCITNYSLKVNYFKQ